MQGPSHKKTKRIEKMYQYADTVEFDLMVVFLVVCVMPLAVFLMQSKTKVGRAMSLALMVLAILYVGGFEHYRMHRPEVTEGGLKAAVFPAAFLDLIESETFTLTYLPIGADPDTIAKASAGIDRRNATTAARVAASAPRRAAPGKRSGLKSVDPAGEPLMVHLSHKGAGDRMFRDALRALEKNTCGGASNETTDLAERSQSSSPACMRWCSGTVDDFRHDVHSFSFDRSTPRDMGLLGRAYRAVFVVRDPRDLVAESYLEHLDTSEAWARLPRDDLGGESFQSKLRSMSTEAGVDVEIDRFTASLSVKLGIARAIGHLGGFLPYSGGAFPDAVDSRVGDFARSLRAFARAGDPDVVFVKYEELLGAKTDGLTLLGEWLGLRRGGAEMRAFVEACVDAREDERAGKGGSPGDRADSEIYSLCEGGGCEERSRRTRRKLPPGAWRAHFTDRNAEKFDLEHGALLRSMGYSDFEEIARI